MINKYLQGIPRTLNGNGVAKAAATSGDARVENSQEKNNKKYEEINLIINLYEF